ncbi:serine hydrolase [Lacticaseibacillus nasuensis]|uniref:serine hydrolase n=1 Tax=Lacticaseibacillus nasuensis TaxID=944671 RepID=UPI002247E9F2|nr:serine hydrolase [Lacticaseibacillus nasuensis]MCX2455936.1 D-alanyl-D-alanine carboxypeptidase [Lacticaseibacillus nasuensis]
MSVIKWKRFIVAAVIALATLVGVAPHPAQAETTIDAKAAIAIDAQSGKILAANNASAPLPIASMSKLVSIYLVREAIKAGRLQWTDTATPDANLVKISRNKALSNVALSANTKYTVRTLYEASLIESANAAVMLLGNAVAGNQTKFVAMMNAKLKEWGITDAHIVNASGLVNKEIGPDKLAGTSDTDENQMSASDMAQVAQHLIADFPDVLTTTATRQLTFAKGTSDQAEMTSWNLLLKGQKDYEADLPVDGLKTGTGDKAGDCFVGTVNKAGMRVITVVMHANGKQSDRRFIQTAKLMKQVYADWHAITIPAGTRISGAKTAKLVRGTITRVPVATMAATRVVVPTTVTAQTVLGQWVQRHELSAPLARGTVAGAISLAADGEARGYVGANQPPRVAVQTTRRVKKGNPFVLIWRGVQEYFGDLF